MLNDSDSSHDDWQTQGNLIVLATFGNAPDAYRLRNELEAKGIRSAIANEQSAHVVGVSFYGESSIEIVVMESDAEAALMIKNDFFAVADHNKFPEWKCVCGETVNAGFAKCWSCMKPHPYFDR